jgi:hypothetical protein
MWLSPMPVVRKVRVWRPAAGKSSRGSTRSRHIRFISWGGPGRATITLPPVRTSQPGAVPTGFSRASPEGMSQACLRFASGIERPRASKRRAAARGTSSTEGVSPTTAEIASRLRSSSVGPRPPPTITRSDRDRARSIASTMRPSLSPTTVFQ